MLKTGDMGMTESNFDTFAEECLINKTDNYQEVLSAIDKLEVRVYPDKFAEILNHFFVISNDYNVVNYILKKMNKHKSRIYVPVLVDALVLEDNYKNKFNTQEIQTQIRVNVAKLLANLKDTSAVNALLYCLNNKQENYKLRLSCAEALGKIGDKFAVLPLSEILKDDNENSVYLKESAAFALGMIGDTKAVEPLVGILETKQGIIDKFTFLKERAIEALSKINFNSDRVFNALKNSLNDESVQVRVNAVEALSNIEDDRVADLLYSSLSDKSEEVVKNVIIALFNLRGEKILYEILNDYSLPEHTMKIIREVIKEVEEAADEEDDNSENI